VRFRRRCARAKRSGGRSGEVVHSGARRDASGAEVMKVIGETRVHTERSTEGPRI
jgi:hypothetical protein